MNKEEKIKILKDAHQCYVDWWLPIDVAAGSVMAPVSFNIFLHYLLAMPEDKYWDRWLSGKIPQDKKTAFKLFILEFIVKDYYENKSRITN